MGSLGIGGEGTLGRHRMPRRLAPTAVRIVRNAKSQAPVVSGVQSRRLLLHAQGLADDPASRAPTPAGVSRLIERMGFVQIDTINTVERAHHLILASRIAGYRPAMLAGALEGRAAKLFEHWTHDASVIPLTWYAHWRHRFARARNRHWHLEQLGDDARPTIDHVLQRITREGPLASGDFEHTGEKTRNSWWGWKPHKIALDYLWRAGELHVVGRRNFQKVYDLTRRAVAAKHADVPTPAEADHVAWACRTALERLGVATVREVAQFWNAISLRQAGDWLSGAARTGEVIPVTIGSADGSPPRPGYALANLRRRLADLPDPPAGIRLLSPFDPVLRDRARAKRLFDFDFRFEGFVPKARRKHGYYVMALLAGDRFLGKVDPKFDRATGTLRIGAQWWQPGINPTRRPQRVAFEEGVAQLATWIGATSTEIAKNG